MGPENAKLTNSQSAPVTRRSILAGLAASAFIIVPRHVLGGSGYIAPSDKVNIACIGTGSQGLRVMIDFLAEQDVHVAAVCDPNERSADYPEWERHEFRTSVAKLLGPGYAGWAEWLSTDREIYLTRTTLTWGGVCGRDPAQRVADAYYASRKKSGEYHGCAAYNDFRELLEKEKDVDAVVVCTPDHWHAYISVAAMKKRKHVFCQKPMTHVVYEARRMAAVARETGVATQVAVMNQASEDTRLLCEWIWGGAIGDVREVINWSNRPVWPQGLDRPKAQVPVPKGFDWDLWVGPSPARPYHPAYCPVIWRGWHDFGTGAIGDMGCYSFDTMFRVLKLEAPETVEAASTELYEETYPQASILHWNFPARGAMPPVHIAWYDGGLKPERPLELEEDQQLDEEGGLLFVGDKGTMLCGFAGENPKLIPPSKMKAFTPPPKTLPRSPGNNREWLNACKGAKAVPGANFEYEAKVTEAILLANVAQRAGRKLVWDAARLRASNIASADKLIQPEYRSGWLV
jgi:predicted dehydrogenase